MTNIIPSASAPLSFSFEQAFNVRAIMIDGDPWFVAVDVCAALAVDPTAIRKLDEDEKGLHSMQTPGGIQEMSVINESGLYTMILRCRDATKPGTIPHKFRKWVTSEVLPSIRKTGGYQLPEITAPMAMELVNRSDLDQLSHIVYLLKRSFHLEEAASHAAYAGLRKQFGLERGIASLPAAYFDQAVQVLTEMEKLAFRFKGIVIDAERKFFRQILRSGKTMSDEEFNALFDSELQQMVEQHRDALKLLN